MNSQLIQDTITKIKDNQATIDTLLSIGSIFIKDKSTLKDIEGKYEKRWMVEVLYNLGDCTIGFASCSETEGVFPEHIHRNVQEYLICVRGSLIETFGSGGIDGMRIVKTGECISIPANTSHSSKPLEADTKIVYVCVPSDLTIPDPS